MPVDSPRSARDWLKNYVSRGMTITVDGKVQLGFPNKIVDPNFSDIQADGAPLGTDIVSGIRDDGFHVFVSRAGKGQRDMSRQTFTPIAPEDDSYPVTREIFGGNPIPQPNQVLASLRLRPLKGWITKKAVTRAGYAAGDYWYAVSVIGPGGSHTMTTDPVKFTVTATGQFLECPLPTEMPDGGRKYGLWLSEVNKGEHTLRLQEEVRPRTEPHTLYGPYKAGGRRRPTKNETAVGRPRQLQWGRPRRRDLWRAEAIRDLLAPMRLRIAVVESTSRGDSLPAVPSDMRDIFPRVRTVRVRDPKTGDIVIAPRQTIQAGTVVIVVDGWNVTADGISVAPGTSVTIEGVKVEVRRKIVLANDEPVAERGDMVTLLKQVFENHLNEAVYIKPKHFHPESRGFKIFCQRDAVENPPWYQLVHVRKFDKASPFDKDRDPLPIYGNVEGGETQGGTNSEIIDPRDPDRRRHFANYGLALVPQDPPLEDASGIEDPSGETDVPTPVGKGRPGAGTYWMTYVRIINGKMTLAAAPSKVTITNSEIMTYHFPARVNKIPNALFRTIDGTREPSHWDLNVSGGSFFTEPGLLYLSTTGQLTDNGNQPNAIMETGATVEQERIETLRGTIGITDRNSGRVRVGLVQYKDDGLLVEGTEFASTLVLATIDLLGDTYFSKRVGAADLLPDVSWHPDAATAKLKVFCIDNPRNVAFYVKDLVWHPFDGEPRRFELPSPGALEPAKTSVDPALPYHSGHIVTISKPPEVQGSGASNPAPLYKYGWESGAKADILLHRNVVNANTECAIVVAAAIKGSYGLRCRSDHTTTTAVNFAQIAFDSGQMPKSGAARTRLRLTRFPTYTGGEAGVLSLISDTGARMGLIVAKNGGKLLYRAFSQSGGKSPDRLIASGLPNGTVVDIEIIAGVGNKQDTLSVNFSVGNNVPKPAGTISVGDLPGNRVRVIRMGCDYLSDRRSRYTFDYDDFTITRRGDVTFQPTTPPMQTIEQPDWPTQTGSLLWATESPGAHTVVENDRENMSVQAALTRSTAPTIDTLLAGIRTTDGTLLAGIYEDAAGYLEVRSGTYTRRILAPIADGGTANVELVLQGAGTNQCILTAYVTNAIGERLLMALETLSFTGRYAKTAETVGRTGLTINSTTVSETGTRIFVDTDLRGEEIYQGYTWINPLDVGNVHNMGLDFEEFFVIPGVEHTWAMRIRYQNAPAGCKPFNVVLYDADGNSYIAARLLGETGTQSGKVVWSDVAVFFTPREGFYRARIESEEMMGGIYIYQQPLCAPERLETEAQRDEVRYAKRSTFGALRVTLRGYIPNAGTGPMKQDYMEQWIRLAANADLPVGAQHVFEATQSNDLFTSVQHGYAEGGSVRLANPDLEMPVEFRTDTTYYVRDVTADSFRLSSTRGGAAIAFATDWSGAVYGVTSLKPQFRSTNDTPPTAWESEWMDSPRDIPQDRKWADVYAEVEGDGVLAPTIEAGQIELVYKQFQPTLLRPDRTPYDNGTVVGGFVADWESSDMDTTPVSGAARMRRETEPLRKIEQELEVDFYSREDLQWFMEHIDEEHIFEFPAANSVMKCRFYEVAEVEGYESELFEESIGFIQATASIGRTQVLESSFLIPPEEFIQ